MQMNSGEGRVVVQTFMAVFFHENEQEELASCIRGLQQL